MRKHRHARPGNRHDGEREGAGDEDIFGLAAMPDGDWEEFTKREQYDEHADDWQSSVKPAQVNSCDKTGQNEYGSRRDDCDIPFEPTRHFSQFALNL
jgi:hypothetical protein